MLYVGPLVSISPITDRLSLVFSPAQSLPLQLMFSSPLTQVALEGTLCRCLSASLQQVGIDGIAVCL